MEFELDRKTSVPYYLQIANNIKQFVESGFWKSGTKLPTERELSERLQVSRNTVSMAYKELQTEGVIVCHQGRGTFVSEQDDKLKQQSRKERLLKIIDVSIEEAIQLGFSLDEFLDITHIRAREKQEMLTQLKIAFIECNEEQINYFVNELYFDQGVSILPVLLSDLKENTESYNEQLKDVDVIITTFFHLEEIKDLLKNLNVDIVPIALELQMETVVKIARFSQETKIGLACKSENFAEKFKNAISKTGINNIEIYYTTNTSEDELINFVNSVDQIVTSPGRKKYLEKIISEKKDIVEVIFKPDEASLNLLKTTLVDLKQKVRGKIDEH
ncbi:GntR family transcriptional regulator [Natranaerobius trueperi]|uniref:GntR family transcriptional regulator n=1 Tax=Natranaerobius trueperi TaxID=759412 RepID=A0A226BY30_9FIRM|nr:GntR family transcriptional regulator [Natranaerobius trueperi]OWZ83109.1 GntR family transcriptional regulator [Natranaerobius trueperi]